MLFLKQFINYIKYLITSKSKYSIHSPFVYDFLINVVEVKTPYYSYFPLEDMRKYYYMNNEVINVTELGAGSKKMKTNKRKISEIAKNSLQKPKYCQLLFRMVNYFGFKTIVELGTSLGISTSYLALANRANKVYSIEGCNEIFKLAQQTINKLKINNVILWNDTFDNALPKIVDVVDKIDLLYIDGNHTKEATLKYINIAKKKLKNNSCIIVDDIYWSNDMCSAWNEIKKDNFFTVTIDLFKLGIIFIRNEQIKQNFIIRF